MGGFIWAFKGHNWNTELHLEANWKTGIDRSSGTGTKIVFLLLGKVLGLQWWPWEKAANTLAMDVADPVLGCFLFLLKLLEPVQTLLISISRCVIHSRRLN